jgi:flagellar P-ring protein precursor FlgI
MEVRKALFSLQVKKMRKMGSRRDGHKALYQRWMRVVLLLGAVLLAAPEATEGARIKDIAKIVGVRNNQLFGYGLVGGLNGTGDKQGTEFTIQTLANMLLKMGINVDPSQVKVKNVAAVTVTAELPAFARPGMKLDVLVSSIGDAKSLQGGTLMITPLQGVDGETYALAQGPLSLGGFAAGGGGEGTQKNHPTVATIPSGALVERAVVVPLHLRERLHFVLHQPDFTTADAVSKAMNQSVGHVVASSQDSRTVLVDVPESFQDHVVDYIARLETIEVSVDAPARVVVNERTGTVVMGENVRISTVAVSHGGLSVVITEEPVISQPSPFGQGRTVATRDKEVSVEEEPSHLMVLPSGVSLGEVVKALNAVGVTPRDLIAILQAMKSAGALSAELVIM